MRRSPSSRTPTILFAQELGAGLGHINRLASIAAQFSDARCIFVLAEPELGFHRLRIVDENLQVLSAPQVRHPRIRPEHPERSLRDILLHLGFADARALESASKEWGDLVSYLNPDLVISDFAPTLRIATAGVVPHLVVGNGFVVPPDVAPLPNLDASPLSDIAVETERRILGAVNKSRRLLGRAPFPRVASMLQGDRSFPLGLPVLDPYRSSRTTPLRDPLSAVNIAPGPSLDDRRGPHVFCYLSADSQAINPILTALNGLDRPSQVFIRNLTLDELTRHCAPQVGIHQTPAHLPSLLPQTRLVIHGATLGTAESALLAGTPQLLFPDTLEREITAQALVEQGVGVALEPRADIDSDALRRIIVSLLDHTAIHDRALMVAKQGRASLGAQSLAAIMRAGHELIECGPVFFSGLRAAAS